VKQILLFTIVYLVTVCNLFAQSNLFFGNKNAFSISTSFEIVEGNNNFIILSPFYSINGFFDFGFNIGYSVKEPNTFMINPLLYAHLLNDESHKIPFNLAYGLGYYYTSSSMNLGNDKIESTSNYLQLYYLLYYSFSLENLIIQPQLNFLNFLGESSSNINHSGNSPNSFNNYKIALAFIYSKNNFTIHLIPSIFLEGKGKNYSIQVGFTF